MCIQGNVFECPVSLMLGYLSVLEGGKTIPLKEGIIHNFLSGAELKYEGNDTWRIEGIGSHSAYQELELARTIRNALDGLNSLSREISQRT